MFILLLSKSAIKELVQKVTFKYMVGMAQTKKQNQVGGRKKIC